MCCILFKNWTNWGLCYKWQSFLCIICLINRFSTVGWYLLFFANVDKRRPNRRNKCWQRIFLHSTDMLKLFLCLFAALWSIFTFWEATKRCLWCGEPLGAGKRWMLWFTTNMAGSSTPCLNGAAFHLQAGLTSRQKCPVSSPLTLQNVLKYCDSYKCWNCGMKVITPVIRTWYDNCCRNVYMIHVNCIILTHLWFAEMYNARPFVLPTGLIKVVHFRHIMLFMGFFCNL